MLGPARIALATSRRALIHGCAPLVQARTMMNRPRNRQPRSQGEQKARRGGGNRGSPRVPYPEHVPNIHQVVPGASVSIVLKQDQSTGVQVQGIVSDVLTRGDHPRGIKVRLTDGRVGRVQKLAQRLDHPQASVHHQRVSHDSIEQDEGLPPARSLADYFPEEDEGPVARPSFLDSTAELVKCPVCNEFSGTEAAVSRHVDEHFQ